MNGTAIRYVIPPNSPLVRCQGAGCGRLIHRLKLDGKRVVVDPDGTPHASTCPASKEVQERARLEARLAELKREGA